VLQTHATGEAVAQIERLLSRPCEASEIRRAGATTALNYAWDTVIQRNLMRQVELSSL
jgi:hypothetical protein